MGTADGRTRALSSACRSVIENRLEPLETRALLSGDVQVIDDVQVTDVSTIEAPAGVTVTRPVVSIVATDRLAHETNLDRGVFTVSRTGSTNKSLNVVFTIRGSAKNGVDYKKIASSVLIPVGASSVKVVIRPIDDDRVEAPETITLVLNENTNYTIDGTGTAKVGLRSNDGPKVNITATDTSSSETNNDRGVFRISRSGDTENDLVVRITVYGKARNGVDFEKVISAVTIPAGRSALNIPIRPVNDVHYEATESVRIQLRQGYYVVGAESKASMTIKDNDAENNADGVITFRAPDAEGQPGHVFYMPASIGSIPTDLTRALNQIEGASGDDSSITLSPDGLWMVLHTNRLDSDHDDFDLVVYPIDNLANARIVAFDTGPAQPLGRSAIASGGDLVIYESTEGPHETDLWAAVRTDGSWSRLLLTGDSTFAVNSNPSISDDGTKILFTGGTGIGQAILEVGTDGAGLRTVIDHNDAPDGSVTDAAIGAADYGPENSIFFHAGWNGNQIWRLLDGAEAPSLFSGALNESNPSVLSDGRVLTLWGDRPTNDEHVLELTLRYADGSLLATLLPGVDLPEGGIGCAG